MHDGLIKGDRSYDRKREIEREGESKENILCVFASTRLADIRSEPFYCEERHFEGAILKCTEFGVC